MLFSETKTNVINEPIVKDMLNAIGYECKFKNRPVSTDVRSGGIGTVIKKELFDKVVFYNTDCQYVQWFCLPNKVI